MAPCDAALRGRGRVGVTVVSPTPQRHTDRSRSRAPDEDAAPGTAAGVLEVNGAVGDPDVECPDAKSQGRGVVSRRRKDTFGALTHTARNANRRVAGAGSL